MKIRKIHKYLGLFIGIQFLLWTVSGIYFSWTNLDKIHGDHFKNLEKEKIYFKNLYPIDSINIENGIYSIELREISEKPYYWINEKYLVNATTGVFKESITEKEAIEIVKRNLKNDLVIGNIELIKETNKHNEYRNKKVPAYAISFDNNSDLIAYVSVQDGKFQTVRHRNWRIFDFLWMTHTMDYKGRDNFNTLLLRVFSLLGFITVLSGFVVWISNMKYKKKR